MYYSLIPYTYTSSFLPLSTTLTPHSSMYYSMSQLPLLFQYVLPLCFPSIIYSTIYSTSNPFPLCTPLSFPSTICYTSSIYYTSTPFHYASIPLCTTLSFPSLPLPFHNVLHLHFLSLCTSIPLPSPIYDTSIHTLYYTSSTTMYSTSTRNYTSTPLHCVLHFHSTMYYTLPLPSTMYSTSLPLTVCITLTLPFPMYYISTLFYYVRHFYSPPL